MNHKGTETLRNAKLMYTKLSEREEFLASQIVDIAIKIHKELGPGLLESVYAKCFYYELIKKDISFIKQKEVPIIYQTLQIDDGLRLDLLVDDLIIVPLMKDRIKRIIL